MTDFFNALKSMKLTLEIDPSTLEIKAIKGREEFVKKLGQTNPQIQSLLDNILSESAIKQMAEPTWGAIPTTAVKKDATWKKSSTLDLGRHRQVHDRLRTTPTPARTAVRTRST